MWKFDNAETFFSKKKNIYLLYGIVSICILLLAFAGCSPKEKTETISTSPPDGQILEKKLERILSNIQGVGKVRVAVTYETGPETVPAVNSHGDSDSVVTLGSGSSAKIAATKEISPRVRGVIVVAEGAKSKSVRADILSAVGALSGAPPYSIAVFPLK